MNFPEGRVNRHQFMPVKIIVRKNLLDLLETRGEHMLSDAPELPLVDSFRQCIDWQYLTSRYRLILRQSFNMGMRHLPPATVQTSLAGEEHFLPARKSFTHVWLIKPQRPQILVVLADQNS